ncbi:manganese and iron superoxide dismutase [Daldinia caldariorum]|uniref:manganese and iron superoxide dismutase n=1 Tax=Daldinia caldariorum TaxID=326644 RepID=UPI0020084527|nr:manganese and iron superoxide dismutase [Daldinia caldariorum]KAI1468784.1 manganese and iron superoxide dismutase [Daldinia caldariorum]
MLRPRLRIPRASRLWRPAAAVWTRPLHSVPLLDGVDPSEGIPGFLSAGGFDFAWTQYQDLIVERLNALTAGTDYEQQDVLAILKSAAREPAQAPIFNYASMAHNNHFFFKNLLYKRDPTSSEPTSGETIPPALKIQLEKQFSSIETLRREFLVTAMAMFGPGFVWLVKNAQSTEMRILTTYLAGSPYTAAHWRRQGIDMNTQSITADSPARGFLERTQVGAGADIGSKFISSNKTAPGGTDVIPLLCLNTWEHVWLRDYGIGARGIGGKRQFVENWWDTINWVNVEDAANIQRPELIKS